MAVIALSSHQRLQETLQARLGPEVAVVCTGVDGDPRTLWPEERSAIARAVPKRQREFAAGRSAARTAMQRLNWPAMSLPAHPDRSPCWPEGLVGSIAHSAETCIAVVGCRDSWVSIGVDIEPDQGIEVALWESICTPEELRQLAGVCPLSRPSRVTKVFVAKEAFYKWHYPIKRAVLEFQDVSVNWSDGELGFEITVNTGCESGSVANGRGQLFVLEGHVVAGFAAKTTPG